MSVQKYFWPLASHDNIVLVVIWFSRYCNGCCEQFFVYKIFCKKSNIEMTVNFLPRICIYFQFPSHLTIKICSQSRVSLTTLKSPNALLFSNQRNCCCSTKVPNGCTWKMHHQSMVNWYLILPFTNTHAVSYH